MIGVFHLYFTTALNETLFTAKNIDLYNVRLYQEELKIPRMEDKYPLNLDNFKYEFVFFLRCT